MQKLSKRSVSIFLTLLFVLSAFAPAAGTFELQAVAQTPVGDEAVTTVIACSDFQYRNTVPAEYSSGLGTTASGDAGGKALLQAISAQMANAGVSNADGFICAGDYDYDLNSRNTTSQINITSGAIAAMKEGVSAITSDDTAFVNIQGNHDPQSTAGGTAPSGDNDPASGAYGVFVINERDYQWKTSGLDENATLQAAENLRRYFNSKIAVDYTAPIFVVSHVPLHYTMRSKNDGETIYARHIFDVLQEAGEQGLNIIFLYGHNHTNGWDDYLGGSKVFLTKGDSINITALRDKDSFTVETLNFT
ncbi:MAG: metallophosphoesterase, partial [Clostridia bacterium]|nr:metallophosphoesterase [Clostridia bacterium]